MKQPRWNSEWLARWIITGVVAFAALAAIRMQQRDPGRLRPWCQEDGIVEYATALFYLLAGGLFVVRSFRGQALSRNGAETPNPRERLEANSPISHRTSPGASGMLACLIYTGLFFFVAGEEISWGQRLLGFQTPARLEQISVKSELTLHNIRGLHTTSRLIGVLACLGICTVLPLAARWNRPIGAFARRRQVPLFPLWTNGVVLAAIGVMAYPRMSWGSISQNLDELGECILGMAFLIFAVEQHFRTQARPRFLEGAVRADARSSRDLQGVETAG